MTALPIIEATEATEVSEGLGRLETPVGNLPLVAVDAQARIHGLAVSTTLTQVFRNAGTEPLQATYIFPLPDRAAVVRFTARIGGRTVDGVLRERGQARREYDEAVSAGRRAAIAEQERSDVFTVRVGNIAPGERAEVELDLVGPLSMDGDEASFRFPLVVAPRYTPGAPMDGLDVGDGVAPDTDLVPDASRISPPVLLPGQRSPVRLSLKVELDAAGLAVHDLASTLHAISTETDGGRTIVQVLPGDRLDRDFVLRFRVGSQAVQTAAVLQPDAEGGAATLAVTLVPPAADPSAGAPPRDVVVLLDRSGSMSGWMMTAARRAAARIVDCLTSADRVAVLAFDHEVEQSADAADLAPATDRRRFAATTFLSGLEARGGTEMLPALQEAARRLGPADPARRRILILVTDGQVGDEDRIISVMRGTLRDAALHVVGIDRAVSAGILNRLAVLGSGDGRAEFVESEDRLDQALDRIRDRIAPPVLTDVRIEVDGAQVAAGSIVPAGRIACAAGVPVVVRARLEGSGLDPVRVRLRASDAAGRDWSAAVQAAPVDVAGESALWAKEHLRHLEDRWLSDSGQQPGLQRQMIEESLRFGVLCRFTAFIAVDRGEKVGEGRPVSVVQPVELPSGWDARFDFADSLLDAPVADLAGSQGLRLRSGAMLGTSAMSGLSAMGPPPGHSARRRLRNVFAASADGGFRAAAQPGLPDRIERVLDALEAALRAGDEEALAQSCSDIADLSRELAERGTEMESDDPLFHLVGPMGSELGDLALACQAGQWPAEPVRRSLARARLLVQRMRHALLPGT